jgi:hypothetical protein
LRRKERTVKEIELKERPRKIRNIRLISPVGWKMFMEGQEEEWFVKEGELKAIRKMQRVAPAKRKTFIGTQEKESNIREQEIKEILKKARESRTTESKEEKRTMMENKRKVDTVQENEVMNFKTLEQSRKELFLKEIEKRYRKRKA